MSDFTIADVVNALAGGPLTYHGLVDRLGARTRTGVVNPDLDASVNYAIGQRKVCWVADGCGCAEADLEHDPDACLLEVAS